MTKGEKRALQRRAETTSAEKALSKALASAAAAESVDVSLVSQIRLSVSAKTVRFTAFSALKPTFLRHALLTVEKRM